MDNPEIIYLTQKALELIFQLSMPLILIATALGFIVAFLQTAIQVQEQTLSFAVKLTAITFSIFILQSQMAKKIMNFFFYILDNLPLFDRVNRAYGNRQTEMIIVVTPYLVGQEGKELTRNEKIIPETIFDETIERNPINALQY